MMNCPIGKEECKDCPYLKDDGTGRMLCDYPYIGAEKDEKITTSR